MGLFGSIRDALMGKASEGEAVLSDEDRLREQGRKLYVPSGYNVREMGGYDTPLGKTRYHRFLRCGGTRSLTGADLSFFRRWSVSRVVDLRGVGESPASSCAFSRQSWVTWKNISLFDYDISSPEMVPKEMPDNYLVSSYLHMLARDEAIKNVFAFFAEAKPNECVLYHCAAGMDRTGMVGMLLLGLVGAPREQVICDYAYSFGTVDEVNKAVARWDATMPPDASRFGLWARIEAVSTVYDTVLAHHGSARNYLLSCGLTEQQLDAVAAHLLEA